MHTLRDSTGLLRCAQYSLPLQALQKPRRRVLCFHTGAVRWGQLRIKASEVLEEDQEICLVLSRTLNTLDATQEDIEQVHILQRSEWLALRLINRVYRLFQV